MKIATDVGDRMEGSSKKGSTNEAIEQVATDISTTIRLASGFYIRESRSRPMIGHSVTSVMY